MALNQFAKISPVVNSEGFLLEKDQSGKYSIKSTVQLKENEIGICIDDKSPLTMFEGYPVKLRGGVFASKTDASTYASNNTSGDFNGQLLSIKNKPDQLYVIVGTQIYSLTENTTKTIAVNIPVNAITENIFNIISNSVMQENYDKEYLINTVDIKMNGEYTFYNSMPPDNAELQNSVLELKGSLSNKSTEIEINDSCYNTITRVLVNEIFKGNLKILLKPSKYNYNYNNLTNKIITNYFGNTISLVITYTPLN